MRHETELMRQILQSPSAQRMIDYVSPIYGEDYVALWLFEIMGRALDGAEETGDSLWDQTVPQTATWALPYWEEEYGVTPDPSWTVEQRQTNILARIQYTAPVNPAKLAALAAAAAGVPCEIVENVAKNTFSVVLHGTTNTLDRVKVVLDEAKPAHLITQFVSQIIETIQNPQDRFLLKRLSFSARFTSYGGDCIVLDGRRRLDGSWHLNQAHTGLRFIRSAYCAALPEAERVTAKVELTGPLMQNTEDVCFSQVSFSAHHRTRGKASLPAVHIKTAWQEREHLSGRLVQDRMWHLDGAYCLNGSKKLNASIIEEDL